MSAIGVTPVLSVADLEGCDYTDVLSYVHLSIRPKAYLEIGTQSGRSLALSRCPSVAIDPEFKITNRLPLADKAVCALYQMKSDEFFLKFNPRQIVGSFIEFAFLDGLHWCEFLLRDFMNTERFCARQSIIALHDCVPVEVSIAARSPTVSTIEEHRRKWWAGDVWRAALALKEFRPDLRIKVLDAQPTGIVLITNLDPPSNVLSAAYVEIVEWMMSLEADELGVQYIIDQLEVQSSHDFLTQPHARFAMNR